MTKSILKSLIILFVFILAVHADPQIFYKKSINDVAIEKITNKRLPKADFSFAVFGDNRDGDYVLDKIIQKINQDKSIKFAFNNGDLVPDGYKKEFKSYIKQIKQSATPIVSIIGNHEIPWYDGEKNYKAFFGKTYFAFGFKNSYFIILDDSDEKGIYSKQLKWLKNQLKISQKYAYRFVFMHVPLYDPRIGEYKKGHSLKNIKDAELLNDLFDKYNVTMLFCSHIHFYYRGFWHSTPFIITGGAGAPLKHFKNHGFYHFIKITVCNKDIKYEVIRINAKQTGFFRKILQRVKDKLDL